MVFDFDGTILDTETPDYETWAAVFAEHEAEIPLSRWATYVGTASPKFDPYAELEQQTGRAIDRAAVRAARQERYIAIVEALPVLPGVLEAIDYCEQHGLKLGVASSSPGWWVKGNLERLGLLPRFGAVRTADDVARTKPEPDLFLAVADALGVAPAEAVAIEDSPNGALAAVRAGMACVVVPNSITRHFTFGQVTQRLTRLDDLPFGDLIEQLNGSTASPSR